MPSGGPTRPSLVMQCGAFESFEVQAWLAQRMHRQWRGRARQAVERQGTPGGGEAGHARQRCWCVVQASCSSYHRRLGHKSHLSAAARSS